jgi:SAM-dependent methyltransferase
MKNYDNFAKTFSNSRKNMKWEEINYFISSYLKVSEIWKFLKPSPQPSPIGRGKIRKELFNFSKFWNIKWKSFLDIGCWNGRLLKHFSNYFDINQINYIWIDSSSEILKEAKKLYPDTIFKNIDIINVDNIFHNYLVKQTFLSKMLKKFSKFYSPLPLGEGLGVRAKFDYIFFIASFHHLENIEKRLEVLKKTKSLLKSWGIIFMTNWDLQSELNRKKYQKSIIKNTKNEFWSVDYNIKIWKFTRYYHSNSTNQIIFLISSKLFIK